MTIGDWITSYAFEAARWLNTAVFLFGLGIAVWAFLRCRKRAYLVFALYFALVLFAWHVWPPISHAIYVYRTPTAEQQKANADFEQAVKEVLAKEGHPLPAPYKIKIDVTSMVMVFGLWLLARREPENHLPPMRVEGSSV
jgi:type II secretory pathway component PulM